MIIKWCLNVSGVIAPLEKTLTWCYIQGQAASGSCCLSTRANFFHSSRSSLWQPQPSAQICVTVRPKCRRLSFPDLIWVAKRKRVWNNPAERDSTHSGVRCSKRGLDIFLKIKSWCRSRLKILHCSAGVCYYYYSPLVCSLPFFLCFSIFSWAPWVQPCWTRSQRRCGSTSKCCSASHPTSVQMQTRWPRFEL